MAAISRLPGGNRANQAQQHERAERPAIPFEPTQLSCRGRHDRRDCHALGRDCRNDDSVHAQDARQVAAEDELLDFATEPLAADGFNGQVGK